MDKFVYMTVPAVAAFLAFLAAMIAGRFIIPKLHKLKFGQTILDLGPTWHKNKQGTPTMGGVIFIFGFLVVLVLALAVCEWWLPLKPLSGSNLKEAFALESGGRVRMIAGVVMALCCGAIGFADDYIKVVKKRNLGLTSLQKMALQLLVGVGYALVMYYLGNASVIHVPFVGEVDLGWWFIPLCVFFVVGMSNATNLTDGIDGLCGSVTVVAMLCITVVSFATEAFGNSLISMTFTGAMAGFLVWNLHPAKVFMGDTGSLLIGGMLCALTFSIRQPLLLIPVGIMYIVETVSVMLQVSYFKLTHGKRLFKMSPIHHHFEMCGWSENKIVVVFCAVTAVCGIAAVPMVT